MSEFASDMWGDMSIGKPSAPLNPKPSDKKDVDLDEDKEALLDKDKKDDELPPGSEEEKKEEGEGEDEEEDEDDGAGDGADPKDKKEGEEEEEEYEFTEDDVNKAFTILDEEGVLEISEEDDFDASPKGLADAVAATVRKKFQAEIGKIPPVVQQFYSHVVGGNDISSFTPDVPTDWEKVKLETEDEQKATYEALLRAQGLEPDEIKEEIEDAVASQRLESKSRRALKVLIKDDEKNKAKREAAEAEEAKKEANRLKSEVDEIKKSIDDSDDFAGFKLDAKRKKEFKEYLFKVDPRTGKTQQQQNMADKKRRMTISFLDFMEYNKEDLEKSVKTDLTRKRNKKLRRYTDSKVAGSNSGKSVVTKVDKNRGKLNIPSIFGSNTIEIED